MRIYILAVSALFLFSCSNEQQSAEYASRQFLEAMHRADFAAAKLYVAAPLEPTIATFKSGSNPPALYVLQEFGEKSQCQCEIYHNNASCIAINEKGERQALGLTKEKDMWLITEFSGFSPTQLSAAPANDTPAQNPATANDTPTTDANAWADGVYYWHEIEKWGDEYYENSEHEIYIDVRNNEIIRGFTTVWQWDEAGESTYADIKLIVSGQLKKEQWEYQFFNICGCADQDCVPCDQRGDQCCEKIERINYNKSLSVFNPSISSIKSHKEIKISNAAYYKILKSRLYEMAKSEGDRVGLTQKYIYVLDAYFAKHEKK